ncbi:hypothetical protein [Enterococcus casseliflavus]|uniref:hypothetical protein n=1 Tax=Enterococcus casseliflavus TaxID=37734 RepID=UPI0025437B9E|nr:hypothetical protein [Enterococcus casseliflavus]MDK4451601.1 hypothetical protein [Enterococcus casseliflavus]
MKLALTDSMVLTKKERKRSITLAIIIGVILMVGVQTVVTEVPKQFVSNIGAQEIIALFVNIFVILAVLLFSRIFESRSAASFGFTTKQPLKNVEIGLLTGFVFLLFVFLVNLLSGSIEVSFNLKSISWLYVIAFFLAFYFKGQWKKSFVVGL